MRPSRHLSFCLFAVALTLSTLVGRAQSGDSASVVYKSRYTQLYRSYVEQPDHIPTLIGLSDFYADSLNPMFNRPLAYYYINQAELYFTDLLQSGKKIREANRLIKQGVNINAIREKRNRIVLSTMAYLLTDPPLTRSEIDHYGQYFKREPSIRQQLNQMKVSAAYRDAEASQGADGYYAFLDRYGGTDEGDSAARLGRMEAKKELLALKQEMISRSFDEAAKKLASLPDTEYVALLGKLAANASVTGEEEIVLNAADRARVGEAVVKAANEKLGEKGRLCLSSSTGEFDGGLILRRGNIEVNCTTSLLVELCRGEMSAAIAGVLFD